MLKQSSVLDPDPDWVRIQLDQRMRIPEGRRDPQKKVLNVHFGKLEASQVA
jgi:hypothetical protein